VFESETGLVRTFAGSALEDPEILSLIEKLTVIPEHAYGYLDGKVVVETGGGGEFSADIGQLPTEFFYGDRPGLYAAGEVIGLYHGSYIGSTSVLRGAVFGRLDGQHAPG
jgi:succinate dehydrogenase/fumarate reductase flavoprotein subunit